MRFVKSLAQCIYTSIHLASSEALLPALLLILLRALPALALLLPLLQLALMGCAGQQKSDLTDSLLLLQAIVQEIDVFAAAAAAAREPASSLLLLVVVDSGRRCLADQ